MKRSVLLSIGCCTIIMLSVATAAPAAQFADGAASEKKVTSAPHGRLPPYYSQVVNQEQRETIYRIQADYQEKLDSLEKQLKSLREERDKKIEAVLTPEQKKQWEKAAAEAKALRAAKTKKNPQPSDEKKPDPPVGK
jgi:hypothetical protein